MHAPETLTIWAWTMWTPWFVNFHECCRIVNKKIMFCDLFLFFYLIWKVHDTPPDDVAGLVTTPFSGTLSYLTTPPNPAFWLVESLSRDFFLQSDWLRLRRACITTRGLEFLIKTLDHLFGALHKYRCFINCSRVTPPVVGRRIPLSRIGYGLVIFWPGLRPEYVLD